MRILNVVGIEIRERPGRTMTTVFALALTVAAIVAAQHIVATVRAGVTAQFRRLDGGIAVVEAGVSTYQWRTAHLPATSLRQDTVTQLMRYLQRDGTSVAPELVMRIPIGGSSVPVVGLTRLPERLARDAAMLRDHQAAAGAALAQTLGLRVSGTTEINGFSFVVDRILPVMGTMDDHTLFVPLSTLQTITGIRGINLLLVSPPPGRDVIATADRVRDLAPGLRLIESRQIDQAVNTMMKTVKTYAAWVLAIIILLAGIVTADHVILNARERRREVAMWVAIGATPGGVLKLFLGRAALLGTVAGAFGYGLGLAMAAIAARRYLDTPLTVLPFAPAEALALAAVAACAFAFGPALRTARLDPALALQEN